MQVVGKYSYFTPKDNLIWGTSESSLVNSQVSYYEVDSNETWREITDLSIFEESLDEVIVTAGGQNYILQLGGPKGQYAYRYVRYSTNGWNRWNRWFNITTEDTAYTDYNSADLFNYLMTSFYGNKNFEGNKLFKNLDLDRFFTITKSNDKGQYYQISDFTDNNAYFKVKFANKLITSHLTAKDSLIGVVNGDINFSTGVENESTPFYSTSVDFKFSNEAFTQKYNEKLTKYVLTLKQGYKDYLLSLNNLSLSINIDLDSLNLPYLSYGLDLNSFVGLDIKSIKIQKLVGPEINFYLIGSCKAEIQASEFIHLLNELGGVWHE